YRSEPDPTAAGRTFHVRQGRVLGGSSSVNGQIYMRGQRSDYDGWAQMGNVGWDYDSVLPYFRKSEANAQFGGDQYHGADGPMSVSTVRGPHPLCYDFLAAAAETGIPTILDHHRESQEGASILQATQRRGRRESSAAAFLHPTLKRQNL